GAAPGRDLAAVSPRPCHRRFGASRPPPPPGSAAGSPLAVSGGLTDLFGAIGLMKPASVGRFGPGRRPAEALGEAGVDLAGGGRDAHHIVPGGGKRRPVWVADGFALLGAFGRNP